MRNRFLGAFFIILVMVFLGLNLVAVVAFTISTSIYVFDFLVKFRADDLRAFWPHVMLFSFPFWIIGVVRGLIIQMRHFLKKRKESKKLFNTNKSEKK